MRVNVVQLFGVCDLQAAMVHSHSNLGGSQGLETFELSRTRAGNPLQQCCLDAISHICLDGGVTCARVWRQEREYVDCRVRRGPCGTFSISSFTCMTRRGVAIIQPN